MLDLCLLAVIAEKPAYGYEMTKRLVERGLAPVAEGSIYPILGRFETSDLVETYHEASNGGPPRKYYRASDRGKQALEEWKAEWAATSKAVDDVLAHTKTEVQR
ncbi:PadR family transcriptional regulator [soil metagenome]